VRPMNFEKDRNAENLLTYVSELLNRCITLADLVENAKRKDVAKITVEMNELYTQYHSTKLFFFMTKDGVGTNFLSFFNYFDEFYFELKHYYLFNDGRGTFAIVEERLESLKENFKELTEQFA
jgi:hypothetical protein